MGSELRSICHLFVDKAADFSKALALLQNGKTQRPGVCNALETLLVHTDIAAEFLPLAQQQGIGVLPFQVIKVTRLYR